MSDSVQPGHDGQDKETPGLASKIFRGGSVLAAGTMIERLVRLGRNMLLARLIAPDQFGVMAIVLAVVALFEALTEVGVAQAVIQNKRGGTPEFLNVAWWFGVARGVLVLALALPLTPLAASFYGQPELVPLLAVALTSTLLTGATSPRIYSLQRQFRFKATLFTMQGSGLLGSVFTLLLTLWVPNVWALVWGTVFEAFAKLVLSFVFCPIRPRWQLDRESRQDLFRFTRGMAGLPLLTFILVQADIFVLGRVVSADDLGLYAMAIVLAGFPLTVFGKVVQPMVVPILAIYQDDMAGMRSTFLRITGLVWLFGLPMATYLAAFAAPILTVIYGRQYAAAAAPFGAYSFYTVVYMASMVSFSVYLSIARPGLQRSFTLVRAGLIVTTMYPASVWLGPLGAALSLLVCLVLAMVMQVYNLRKVIGLSPLAYLGTVVKGTIAAVVVASASFAIVLFIETQALLQVVIGALPVLGCWAVSFLIVRRGLRALPIERRSTRV